MKMISFPSRISLLFWLGLCSISIVAGETTCSNETCNDCVDNKAAVYCLSNKCCYAKNKTEDCKAEDIIYNSSNCSLAPTNVTSVSPTTTTKIITTTTVASTTSVTSSSSVPTVPTRTTVIPPGRHFDAPSFIGGIVLALGLLAIIYISFKFYKARTERNYHTL
ncbi:sialomucin core protein 24 [Parasteatoda tepidariorum]|uniref:sialomucin core protein 24 n=1 Tax=Parasteatoda tepidariorum TaxID=114398 RepID=UPI00077FAA88|nr:sialomucin core protein 24 [Parasteatoda tepidariorum]